MIPIHPLAKIFPALEGAAFDALKADIAANGLSVPITLWRGAILDGRNRYRALVELGLVPAEARAEYLDSPPLLMPVEHVDGLEPGDLPAFVISRNLNRRHLTESQRATVAASLVSYGHGGDRRARGTAPDQAANLPVETAITTQRAAEMLRVSERSVRDARALFKGPIQLVEDVREGRVAVSAAAQALRQEMQQRAAAPPPGSAEAEPPSPHGGGMEGGTAPASPDAAERAVAEQDRMRSMPASRRGSSGRGPRPRRRRSPRKRRSGRKTRPGSARGSRPRMTASRRWGSANATASFSRTRNGASRRAARPARTAARKTIIPAPASMTSRRGLWRGLRQKIACCCSGPLCRCCPPHWR